MKIITYNLRFGGNGERNHWNKIIREFSPDLVLAQETYNPQDYFPAEQYAKIAKTPIWEATPAKWGSAIVSTRYELIPIPVQEFQGNVVGGRIEEFSVAGVTRPLSIFSIHTPSGNYIKLVNEILDCISERAIDTEILIGGDFNVTMAARHPSEEISYEKGAWNLLERLRTQFGLINSWQAIHPNTSLHQTLRWSNKPENAYHCDAIFIPHSWLRHLESCEILSNDWMEMSDHNPIVATFSG